MAGATSSTAVTSVQPTPAAAPLVPLPLALPLEQETLVASSRSAQLALVVLVALAVGFVGGFAMLSGGLVSRPAPALDARLDLNRATEAELALLPGIGPNRAQQIVKHRDRQGGFRAVDDLLDVPGIGPNTLQRIRADVCVANDRSPTKRETAPVVAWPRVNAAKSTPTSLDPNTATLAQLDTLPGIGPTLGKRIIDERERQPFASAEEMRRVKGIGPKTLEKIRPYLRFDSKLMVKQ